jgi:hypothetical protein
VPRRRRGPINPRKLGWYAWGRNTENDLKRLLAPILPAHCRSSRSGGLFDVWAAGRHVYLFQCKRTESQKHAQGFVGVGSLLRAYERVVTAYDAVKIVAVYHKRNVPGRNQEKGVRWRFFMSEDDYQKMRSWAAGE